MSQKQDWTDSVVDVVDEMVQQTNPDRVIETLQDRREAASGDLEARCTEGIAYVRRVVADE